MNPTVRWLTGFFLALLTCLAPAQIELPNSGGSNPLVPNNRWALVVGVSGYAETVGPLKYTAKEAKEVSQTLKSDLAFAPENVRLLADDGQSETPPTSANILGALDSLLGDKRLDKANLFVFYFSGHGVATPKGDFLLPADAQKGEFEQKGVPVREVIRKIVDAGLKNVLFIADACRAGTENDFGEDLSELCHKANIAVILGCAPGKRSYEYPSLKQGAFTHFLLEGLKRPELRDASGALWASKLGIDLQTRVHDFTEPDHGKYAQVPSLWGDQSTLDVLLAAYPQPPVSDEAVRLFRTNAQKLNKADYAAAMIAYAMALYEKDRTDETVELLKTVDALGELTPSARMVLAVALDTLGRTGEAQRVYMTFLDLPPGLWRNMGIAASTARSLDPAIRIKAALDLFEAGDSWSIKYLAFSVIQNWGSAEQKLHYARLFAAADPNSARKKAYGEARVAYLEGRWADSIKAYDLASQSPGESPSDSVIFSDKIYPLIASGNAQALQDYTEKRDVKGFEPGLAFLIKAERAKDRNDSADRVANLKAALAADLSPTLLIRAAKVAGPYIGLMMEEFKTAAAKHPYSWRARMVTYFVSEIKGDKKEMEQAGYATDRYMDDRLTVFSTLFDFMDTFMTEAVQLKRLDPTTYRAQLDYYYLVMRDYSEGFGFDADLWMQFVKYGMFNERNGQVQQVVAKRLKMSPTATPKAFRPVMFLLAVNRGDFAAARQLFQSKFEPTEQTDPAWFYATYLVTLGKPDEARQLVEGIAPPSPELAESMEALKTYLLAVGGKTAEAKKRLAKTPEIPVIMALHGLAWSALGDWTKAEPLLLKQSGIFNWSFLFLQEYATHTLDTHYRTTARLPLAQDLASIASISQPGNPLYDHYSYNAKPGLAQFAGTTKLSGGTLADKEDNLTGTTTFTVTPTGAFTATFAPTKGTPILLKGTTDANGNVHGSATSGPKTYTLTAKIAPPALYKTYPRFHSQGQIFQLIDPEGFRIIIVGRT